MDQIGLQLIYLGKQMCCVYELIFVFCVFVPHRCVVEAVGLWLLKFVVGKTPIFLLAVVSVAIPS